MAKLIILETAVQGAKVIQDLELESFPIGVEHSQKVKATPIETDYGSRDCVNLAPSTAVSRIMGIDPGTVVTGYGIVLISPTGMQLIDFGCIRPPAKYKLSDRYLILYDSIGELLEKHAPQAVAIETQFVHHNPQSAIKLGMARGIMVIAARKKGATVFEYTPKKAKLAVTGSGNASKHQVQAMIQHLFRLPTLPEPADAADALALAVCHAHAMQSPKLMGIEY